MPETSGLNFEYRNDDVNSSLGILGIRLAVGIPISMVAGFVGNIINGIFVPSPIAGDEVAFLARMLVLGIAASTGGMVAWFNALESKSWAMGIWIIAAIGGLISAVLAYYFGSTYIDHPDVYILNQRLTQTIIIGAAIGSNVCAAGVSIIRSRMSS